MNLIELARSALPSEYWQARAREPGSRLTAQSRSRRGDFRSNARQQGRIANQEAAAFIARLMAEAK